MTRRRYRPREPVPREVFGCSCCGHEFATLEGFDAHRAGVSVPLSPELLAPILADPPRVLAGRLDSRSFRTFAPDAIDLRDLVRGV